MDLQRIAESRASAVSQRRLRSYTASLWDLCTEILGYDKLSETFHKPMLDDWDRVDRARFSGKYIDMLDLWPRDHIKTWCERARVLRAYLVDPTLTVTWWHAVEEMACESAVAIGKTFQLNKEFRKLRPEIMPSVNAKKFVTASGFSLRANRIGDAPSMRAWGSGSEATGGHSRVGVLDDPWGYNDLVDSQFPAKRRWMRGTVRNVIRVSEGWLDAIGTRWDKDDPFRDMMESPYWKCRVRACMETEGKPDYNGVPVYLTQEQIDKKRYEMGSLMFALQMMNDAEAQGEKPWKVDAEQFCTLKDAAGAGFVVVIGDPAPANVGAVDTVSEKIRGDGAKDPWAWAVVKLRANGQRREIVLLDLVSSRSWSLEEGFVQAARLMRKWNTKYMAYEATGQALALYRDQVRRVMREEGIKYTPIELTTTYKGKNQRFAALCSRLESDEFFVCESVPTAEQETLFEQCRGWMPLPSGRNGLRFDDHADVVSYATDPVFTSYIPKSGIDLNEWSPYRPANQELAAGGSRHVRW